MKIAEVSELNPHNVRYRGENVVIWEDENDLSILRHARETPTTMPIGDLIPGTPQPDYSIIDNPAPLTDDVRELPTWGLPVPLQRVVEDITKGYRSHRDFVVASLMSAVACIVGKRVTACRENYINHATIWLIVVADSSRGKSQPFKFFLEPIQEMENDAFRTYKEDMKRWESNKCVGEKPIYHRRTIGNATDEFVLKVLAENGDIFLFNDEMRGTFESWGLYKNGANGVIVGNLLSIFDYQTTSIDRVSAEPLRLVHPNLSMAGTTQPSVLKPMMGRKGFDKDGMFQRFLYVYPERKKRPPRVFHEISESSKETWREYVKLLSSGDFPDLYETPDAKQLHDEVLTRWDGIADEYEEKNVVAMGAYMDKLSYHLCRWCACVAVLRGEKSITAEVMRYSIECMEYFKWCAERAFCLIANPEDDTQRELTNGELLREFAKRFPDLNQSKLAEAISKSQQYVNKELNK